MRPSILCVALLAALLVGDKASAQWRSYPVPGGGSARVQFPGQPTLQTVNGTPMAVYTAPGGVQYVAGADRFQRRIDITNRVAVRLVLNAGRDSSVRSASGTLVSERDVTLGRYPGRAFTIGTSGGIGRVRLYVTENRVYVLIVGGTRAAVTGSNATRFLGSLSIPE
jgi:hypothetical protein